MVSAQTIQEMKELRLPSSMRLPNCIIIGMTQSFTRARYQLIVSQKNPKSAGFQLVPTNGTDTLLQNTQAARKLLTIDATTDYTGTLNKALAGGESYPILTAVLGTIAGVASAGAGLLFTIGTTALDVSKTHKGVQARHGDELWQVEEIGKVRKGAGWEVMHVGSYFLVDPFRGQTMTKGWLIHEERAVLSV